MKKTGFTLAEILITLGIIGVVAALTMPSLMTNVGQSKIGPSLAKFVNSVENGLREGMSAEGLSSLSDAQSASVLLSKHMNISPAPPVIEKRVDEVGDEIEDAKNEIKFRDGAGVNTYSVRNTATIPNAILTRSYADLTPEERLAYDVNNDGSVDISDITAKAKSDNMNFVTKEGFQFLMANYIDSNDTSKYPGGYKGIIAEVFIDIDGQKSGANKAGHDVFLFLLDKSGRLVPAGGSIQSYLGKDYGDYAKTKTTCDAASSTIAQNFACTGAVADNGWKANY